MAKKKELWKQSKEELLLVIWDLTLKIEELTKKLSEVQKEAPKPDLGFTSVYRICDSIDKLRKAIESKPEIMAGLSEKEELDNK